MSARLSCQSQTKSSVRVAAVVARSKVVEREKVRFSRIAFNSSPNKKQKKQKKKGKAHRKDDPSCGSDLLFYLFLYLFLFPLLI